MRCGHVCLGPREAVIRRSGSPRVATCNGAPVERPQAHKGIADRRGIVAVGQELIGEVLDIAKLERGESPALRGRVGHAPPFRRHTSGERRACTGRLSGCGSCLSLPLRAKPSMPLESSRSISGISLPRRSLDSGVPPPRAPSIRVATMCRMCDSAPLPHGSRSGHPALSHTSARGGRGSSLGTVSMHGSSHLLCRGRAVRAVPPRFARPQTSGCWHRFYRAQAGRRALLAPFRLICINKHKDRESQSAAFCRTLTALSPHLVVRRSAAGVGFEPTRRLHAQRFSRPLLFTKTPVQALV